MPSDLYYRFGGIPIGPCSELFGSPKNVTPAYPVRTEVSGKAFSEARRCRSSRLMQMNVFCRRTGYGLRQHRWGVLSVHLDGRTRRYASKNANPINPDSSQSTYRGLSIAAAGLFAFGTYLTCKKHVSCESPTGISDRLFTLEEVSQHTTKQTGIWVTYKDGVYDITDFVEQHPGGSRIMLASGGSIDPFWDVYGVHKKPEVFQILESYRIGSLCPEDILKKNEEPKQRGVGPYSDEPPRHPALVPLTSQPCNAEPPNELLVDSLITPNDLFFVRNHLPVPRIDPAEYRLVVSVDGDDTLSLTLGDIDKLQQRSVIATVQCSGNRRSEMSKVKPIKGLAWTQGAISNAKWTGVSLRDVLVMAGVDVNRADAGSLHVHFEGLDKDPMTGNNYAASIPFRKAVDPLCDVVLVTKMNDQPLPRDHGFPLRAIVPGVTGARSVKWLGKVAVRHGESESHWQKNDYKSFSPNIDWDTVDFTTAPAIQDVPVNSAICWPKAGQHLDDPYELDVKGYAWSGGGRAVIRVDVSADNGLTWHTAELSGVNQPLDQSWSWKLWHVSIPVTPDMHGECQLTCKAVDAAYNNQPESPQPIWNLRGVLNNSWHRVTVTITGSEQSLSSPTIPPSPSPPPSSPTTSPPELAT